MIKIVIDARDAAISKAMQVKRILPFRRRQIVGPFIFLDHARPILGQPPGASSLDMLPHPHIGLSTVSYLFGRQVTHRDSLGVKQIIRPGEVNQITAGSSIAHSERFEDPAALAGESLEIIQTQVALPEKDEEAAPSFKNYTAEQLKVYTDKGTQIRLIAGNAYKLSSTVATNSSLFYLHVILRQSASFSLPKEHSKQAFYIAKGSVEVSENVYRQGQMVVFNQFVDPTIVAKENSTLMLLGGKPLGERFIWWNFMSSRKERIEQAKEDWQQGRIKLPPTDNAEFIPLPEGKSKPAGTQEPEPLS